MNRLWIARLAVIAWGTVLLAVTTAQALPPKVKDEFQRQMRGKSVEMRVAAVDALREHADPESARLIFLLALADEAPEVRQAGRQTLLRFADSQPIGQRLLDDAKAELLKGAKGQGVAAGEAIRVLCEFESPAIHTGLLNLLKQRESGSPLPQLLKSRPTPQTAVPAADAMMSAIDAWGMEKNVARVPRLERFAKSEHFAENYGFRKCIVDAAIAMHDPAAITLLLDTLGENTGRTRSTALVYLARATGQQLGADAKEWKNWWQANRESAKLAAVGDLTLPDKNGSYYEIPIQSQRVVFVIDTSDSMRAGEKGVTRMDAAKKALIQTLNELSGNVEFNVVAFHDGVTLWKRSGLLPANAKNKADAVAFVQKWTALGKTATYDGLMAGFDCDPNLEAIFCVSDGDPSTGRVVDPAQILAEVRQLNRVRRVNIHGIGVFGGQQYESLAQFMKTLAEQNGGEFKRVD